MKEISSKLEKELIEGFSEDIINFIQEQYKADKNESNKITLQMSSWGLLSERTPSGQKIRVIAYLGREDEYNPIWEILTISSHKKIEFSNSIVGKNVKALVPDLNEFNIQENILEILKVEKRLAYAIKNALTSVPVSAEYNKEKYKK